MRSTMSRDERVLVLAPPEAAAEALEALGRAGLAVDLLGDVAALDQALREGAGVLVVAAAGHEADIAAIATSLEAQPAWSDLPVVVLAADEESTERAGALLGDRPVLDRPVDPNALVSAVRSGLRVRRHQYRLRDELLPRPSIDGFRTYFELPAVGAAQTDPATFRYVRVNRRFCEITGYSEQELLGMRVQDVTHPDDHSLDRQTMAAVMRGERDAWTVEKRYVRKDGKVTWVHVSGQLLRDTQGRPVLTVATVADIDERMRLSEAWRRREQELRESEARFRRLADSAPVLIWQADVDKQCVWFNQRWMHFTGRPMEAELGEGWLDGVHPADLHRCIRTFVESFDRHRAFEMEFRLRGRDGTFRWMVDHGEPLYTPAGDFSGFIGTCLDITDRREAEQALRRADEFHSIIADLASDFAFTARVEPDGRMVTDAVTEGFERVLG
ncbi:MAG TPA: PAS domain S-box protein, partial [Gemmatimonadales bacterium]|nr:PAS domain S-box protein [Gemmatimonadales bacterium]